MSRCAKIAQAIEDINEVEATGAVTTWLRDCFGELLPPEKCKVGAPPYEGEPLWQLYGLKLIAEIMFSNVSDMPSLLTSFGKYLAKRQSIQSPLRRAQGFSSPDVKSLLEGNRVDASKLGPCVRCVECDAINQFALNRPLTAPITSIAAAEEVYKEFTSGAASGFELRSGLPLFWFTTSSDLNYQSSVGFSDANVILGSLGMTCLGGKFFMLLRIPEDILSFSRRPTLFDALAETPNLCYVPAGTVDGWGRTRKTLTWTQELREATHPTLAWPNGGVVDRPIGPSRGLLPKRSDWERFVSTIWKELCTEYPDLSEDLDSLFGNVKSVNEGS
ncbi:MAG: hypothetical protein IPH75_14785 [bacterium]|nr:hypothetical protein [bacterium]